MNYNIAEIIQGYAQGYFLMADDNNKLDWYGSRDRTLIPLNDKFRYPKSLRRVLNQDKFQVAINQDFPAVVEGCADRETTWISEELKQIYYTLHKAGWAHSFETWSQDNQLAGGILGIAIRGVFIGESMFFRIPDGSKVAMVKLVEHLRSRDFQMFDAQMMNPHLARFGAFRIGEHEYKIMLQLALSHPCKFV